MRATGIVRRIDDLGRLVVPETIRTKLNIREGDPFELFIDGNMVCFKPYHPTCDFCETKQAVSIIGSKAICPECLQHLKEAWADLTSAKNEEE